jgi:NMD protein affecting ribosome stability and mRNA decay
MPTAFKGQLLDVIRTTSITTTTAACAACGAHHRPAPWAPHTAVERASSASHDNKTANMSIYAPQVACVFGNFRMQKHFTKHP